MKPATLEELEAACELIYRHLQPTPQIAWPLLAERCGCEVWVKHENHTPIGAFKVRGGLVYLGRLKEREPDVAGVISATRGNHGQSIALAARLSGLPCAIVVPEGNSREKNNAMRAFGAELIVKGHDFQAAAEFTAELATERGYHFVPSFHDDLYTGVGTYALELLRSVPDLDAVYVPIGMGSGICGIISARDALDLKTEIIGVTAEQAAAYAFSFKQGKPVNTNSADTIADGMACRVPNPHAVEIICAGAARVITVSEQELMAAMNHYFTDIHNVAEGAGAAPLAGLLQEREQMAGKRVGLILSGGNVDSDVFRDVLGMAAQVS